MNEYKKDFESAVEMVDWQNKMLKQQADEIEKLKEDNAELQRLFDKAMSEWEKERKIPK
jgi:cell shape-determining protein MreC